MYKNIVVCGSILFTWRNRVEIVREIDQDAFISSEGKVSQLNEVSMYANWLIRKLLVNMYLINNDFIHDIYPCWYVPFVLTKTIPVGTEFPKFPEKS